ncbi:unnamed protein product [Angiostrongylus costaricensis]|uniref:Uncharacterized protein n=1 Tax=Angiostrongylus costaricensis TaxID=334426 RepID=A0A0R3PF88_ANGCS|nr:unnamed protein product [Angiostrongylus costaricensis]
MASLDAPPPLVVKRRLSASTSDASCEDSTSTELAVAEESTNRSSFALLVSGMACGQRKDFENLLALNVEDCSVIPKKIPSTVVDRNIQFAMRRHESLEIKPKITRDRKVTKPGLKTLM